MDFTRSWRRLNEKTIGTDAYWSIAVQNESIYFDTLPLAAQHIKGRTLDVGAGNLAWKRLLSRFAGSYVSSDVSVVDKRLDLVFDATQGFPFKNASFDSLFCHSVLEHTVMPWVVFKEFHRVLNRDGKLLLSVPFLFYLHGAPRDFFRFTKYGVAMLAKQAGFGVERIECSGGIFHFLLNIPSVALSALMASCRLDACIPCVTKILRKTAQLLDRIFDPHGMFALNIICVLRKNAS